MTRVAAAGSPVPDEPTEATVEECGHRVISLGTVDGKRGHWRLRCECGWDSYGPTAGSVESKHSSHVARVPDERKG